MTDKYDILVIGGGAAGFFSAIEASQKPGLRVGIIEKSNKLLAKVKISGGGRCNVTHSCFDNDQLARFYPRGEKQLRRAFHQFDAQSTLNWFNERGVEFYTMPDNCIFPKSDNSQTIIDCLLNQALKNKVEIHTSTFVKSVSIHEGGFQLELSEGQVFTKKLIIATGGSPKLSGFDWLKNLKLEVVSPVPSLFTFNMPGNEIVKLMGNVVVETSVRVEGTKLKANGPLLVTHWGMSGPAVLKLSAWGARILEEKNYQFSILVNWLNERKEDEVRQEIESIISGHGAKKIVNFNPFPFTNRLFEHLLSRTKIDHDSRWKDLAGKRINLLVNTLVNDRYEVSGKTTFKEEFVTAGGIALSQIDFNRMSVKHVPGLFFAGEILDIDGITGGFNFQAAWTTGFIAGKSAREEMEGA